MTQRRCDWVCFVGGVLAAIVPPISVCRAQNPGVNEAITKVNARFESSTARRGEVITWTLTVDLTAGWHTYPTRQPDDQAASYVNKFRFPTDTAVVFVGELAEPKAEEKFEDGVRILVIEGQATWTRQAVVRPDAKPGKVKIPVRVTILACAERCLPPKTMVTEAELTISDLPPVPVDPKYRGALSSPTR